MHERSPGVLRLGLPATALAAMAACHAPATRAPVPDRAPPPVTQAPVDASYDWHVLLIAPFGSVLKDIPGTLHEVLLFRDEAPGAAATDDMECYGPDSTAPRFLGRAPDEYLLCFKQDRLSRVQASVRLTAAQAPDVFAAACAGWLQQAEQANAAAAPAPGAETPDVELRSDGGCKGRAGAVRFSARLGEEPETTLSIVLDSVADP